MAGCARLASLESWKIKAWLHCEMLLVFVQCGPDEGGARMLLNTNCSRQVLKRLGWHFSILMYSYEVRGR
jgi:hypothetical protein